MSGYLSELLQQRPYDTTVSKLKEYFGNEQFRIKYITVFKPRLVDEKEESEEELLKQILCFETDEDSKKTDSQKLRILGLLKGVCSLSANFNDKFGDGNVIFKAERSITSSRILENGLFLATSVAIDTDNQSKKELMAKGVGRLIEELYFFFTLLTGSSERIIKDEGISNLREKLQHYFSSVLKYYNDTIFANKLYSWPLFLNYKGFLGLIGEKSQTTFRKSSLSTLNNKKVRLWFDMTLGSCAEVSPEAVIVSCFDKSEPSNYGFLYSESAQKDGCEEAKLDESSMINLYNYLEYLDHHNKFDRDTLTKKDIESSILMDKLQATDSLVSSMRSIVEGGTSASGMSSFYSSINPFKLTGDYIAQPINGTLNSVWGLSNGILANTSGNASDQSMFLDLQNYLKNFTFRSKQEARRYGQDEESADQDDISETESDYSRPVGRFLTGLNQETNEIDHMRVFLKKKIPGNVSGRVEDDEYFVVVYHVKNINFALVYRSSETQLKEPEFYRKIEQNFILPAYEELCSMTTNGMENSIGSLPLSLKNLIDNNDQEFLQRPEEKRSFYFTVYDYKEGWIKSSLPYLKSSSQDYLLGECTQGDYANRIENERVVRLLHFQLSEFFIAKRNKEYFNFSAMNECFHKFEATKKCDWIFYYIEYRSKCIVIIKSVSHGKSRLLKPKATGDSLLTNGEEPSKISTQVSQKNDGNLYEHISNYANLGFLDNLGYDVKSWLASFSTKNEN